MAKCPKCNGRLFILQERAMGMERVPVNFVLCAAQTCKVVVGVCDATRINYVSEQVAEVSDMVRKIARRVGVI